MDCPNCGAAMQLDKGMDSWSCIYCKTVYHSEANDEGVHVLSDASSFTCPLCSLPLAQAAMDGHKLYYCTRCHGILIAVPVFVSLLDQLRAKQAGAWTIPRPADPSELRRQIKCPQCRSRAATILVGRPILAAGHLLGGLRGLQSVLRLRLAAMWGRPPGLLPWSARVPLDPLFCSTNPGLGLQLQPTKASAAVQGNRPGDHPTINAGVRSREN